MVKYRPNPHGMNIQDTVKWQGNLGSGKMIGYEYAKYRYYDFTLRNIWGSVIVTTIALGFIFLPYKLYTSYDKTSDFPLLHKTSPKIFEYSDWARDSRKARGTWNNNFSCWSDMPDCGKDYKKRYFS
jgi:hypothetical protein